MTSSPEIDPILAQLEAGCTALESVLHLSFTEAQHTRLENAHRRATMALFQLRTERDWLHHLNQVRAMKSEGTETVWQREALISVGSAISVMREWYAYDLNRCKRLIDYWLTTSEATQLRSTQKPMTRVDLFNRFDIG